MKFILNIVPVAMVVIITACSGSRTGSNVPPVVDAIEVRPVGGEGRILAQSGSPIVLLDVRTPEEFSAERATGARLIPIAEWKKAAASPDAALTNAAAWQPRIDALGISEGAKVLVYDAGEMTEAARVWFVLQHFGLTDVSVVNGGWASLKLTLPDVARASGPAGVVSPVARPITGTDSPGIGLKTKDELRSIVRNGGAVRILDARAADEFAGINAMNNARTGHLPGAVNIPHLDLLKAGRLKSPAELRRMFEAAGLKPEDVIVTHCQGGGRASLAALALRRAGYGDVQNYYLSFGEWAADESCPIEPGH